MSEPVRLLIPAISPTEYQWGFFIDDERWSIVDPGEPQIGNVLVRIIAEDDDG